MRFRSLVSHFLAACLGGVVCGLTINPQPAVAAIAAAQAGWGRLRDSPEYRATRQVALPTAPAANATKASFLLGSALSGGNTSGTYLGANGTGAADLADLQASGVTKLGLTSAGRLRAGQGMTRTLAGMGFAGTAAITGENTASAFVNESLSAVGASASAQYSAGNFELLFKVPAGESYPATWNLANAALRGVAYVDSTHAPTTANQFSPIGVRGLVVNKSLTADRLFGVQGQAYNLVNNSATAIFGVNSLARVASINGTDPASAGFLSSYFGEAVVGPGATVGTVQSVVADRGTSGTVTGDSTGLYVTGALGAGTIAGVNTGIYIEDQTTHGSTQRALYAVKGNINAANGDLVSATTTRGLVLRSPDSHYWRATISNAGVVTWADLGTSLPN